MKPAIAILFDLDGTLLDTAPEFTRCLNTLLKEENKQSIQMESLRPYVSQGVRGMCHYGFKNYKPEKIESLICRFVTYYEQYLGQQTRLFEGMNETLDTLVSHNIPWGIVTNKPKRFTLPLIKQFDILTTARTIICGDTTPEPKPSPKHLFLAAKALAMPTAQCWYVGDAKTDLEASRAAGMSCAIANYGYLPPEEDPQTWQADHYLDAPYQLLTLIT